MDGVRAPRGFSLIELLVALAILAIALAFGSPSLRNSHLNARRAAAVNAFMHTLYSARSESLLHVEFVSVCPSLDQQQCSANRGDWTAGWISFINKDHDQPAHVDPGETVLSRHAAVAGVRILANRDSLVFRHDSFTGTTASFFFCDERGGSAARAVIVSQTGRPRLSESDAYGKPLKCDPAG
ncbi:MAG: GspH/FimT family protein [Steroidobacterales bacterium]